MRPCFDVALENRGTSFRITGVVSVIRKKKRFFACIGAEPSDSVMHAFRLVSSVGISDVAKNFSLMNNCVISWNCSGTLPELEEGVRALQKIGSRLESLDYQQGEAVTFGEMLTRYARALDVKWILIRECGGYEEFSDDPLIPVEDSLQQIEECLMESIKQFME